jgi:melibiose permease/lactose/raffinose/galactose permease
MEKAQDRRNTLCFGLGTIGRDMFYTMVSMYIMVYITEVLTVPDATLALMTTVLLALRIFDAFNDPFMGLIVDNTKTRFGKFKPGMLIGAVVAAVSMVMMFFDFGLTGASYAIVFAICYLLWDISFGLNDIAYWSMMPALSTDQKQREKIGSFARICASIGLFALVVGIIPVTGALGEAIGNLKQAWFYFALIIAAVMLGFQAITLIGVKEHRGYFKEEENTSLLEMFLVIIKNDQLLWVAVSMSLFMIGYITTTSFGVHFFKYAYGDENMYSIFAAVLGISQLSALGVFTLFSKRFTRRRLYTGSTALVAVGYILFFFAPMNMLYIGAAGVFIFVGQAFIQLLMLMFLADSIEYGQWKLGKRNESITFSIQPFINKIGGAIATGVLGLTLIISGINAAETAADVPAGGITVLKVSMLLLPLVTIVAGYIINMMKFKIDEKRYAQILSDLQSRGDITT